MRKLWYHGNFPSDLIVWWLLTSGWLIVMFSSFYRHNEWNLFFAQCSLSWMHLLAVKAILSARCGSCVAMAKSRSNVTNKSWRDGGIFLLFCMYSLAKDVCVFISTLFCCCCNQSPEPVGNTWAHSTAQELPNTAPPAVALLTPTQYLPGSLRGRPEAAARLAAPSACSRSAEGRKFGPWKKKWEGCWAMLRLLIRTTCVHQNKSSGNIRRRDCRDENKHQTKQWKRELLFTEIKHLD